MNREFLLMFFHWIMFPKIMESAECIILYAFCIVSFLVRSRPGGGQKSFYARLYTIMSKVPEQTLKESFNRFIKKTDRKETKWVRILTFPTPNKAYGYRTRWYEHSADIDFEGITFRGIRDYDQYLSFKFGEYHKLPPEGQRKVHPVSNIRVLEKV